MSGRKDGGGVLALALALALAGCLAACSKPPQSPVTSAPELPAAQFLDRLGVCAHVSAPATSYGDVARIGRQLAYVGLRHVRDDARSDGGHMLVRLAPLGQAGVKFDIIVGAGIAPDPAAFLPDLRKIAAYLDAIEGPNEIEQSRPVYAGKTGDAGAAAYQQALYRAVKSDPVLGALPVYNFTVQFSKDAAGFSPASMAADFGNVHSYSSHGRPLGATLVKDIRATLGPGAGRPFVVSELGYTSLRFNAANKDKGGGNGVDEATQAKLTLDAIFDAALAGASRTYIYELQDEFFDPKHLDGEAHLGLFAYDGRAKPLAAALHNLREILQDPLATGPAFNVAPSPIHWRVAPVGSGDAPVRVLQLRARGGGLYLALWREPQVWNDRGHAPLAEVSRQRVQIEADRPLLDVAVFDPIAGTAAVAAPSAARPINVILTDHPVLVRLTLRPNAGETAARVLRSR